MALRFLGGWAAAREVESFGLEAAPSAAADVYET